mmetsp:Transcript_36487/g.60439  ORF Transcript_36487/g.60439 Transcript_36487/m.60439 type:complete len:458 (-) Transcript_36487:171-1544(-)|eukprot:CAMPEP_0119300938 /NCGR_PEP_ID=MMETSP1333-20130426/2814_1 /TAXON_ID=418940 /ORGANISM="Scyphosphaera apsteinii, Strain RCC1455" /LENGTH=457 /DNA_ID=CAMNT_0007302877 /DNA_START=192 /DNA_END=1565 /DNA_ORIENTATION=+
MGDIDTLLSLVPHCELRGVFSDAVAPAFELTVPAEELTFGDTSNYTQVNFTAEADRLDAFLSTKVLLCRVRYIDNGVPKCARPRRRDETKHPFLLISLSTSFSYVYQRRTRNLRLWRALGEWACYTNAHGLLLHLWLGTFSDEQLNTRTVSTARDVPQWLAHAPKRSIICDEPSLGSGHVLKTLAALLAFRRMPHAKGLVYVDADTLPANSSLTPDAYLSLAPRATDLIGTTSHGVPSLMNSGVWLLRNSVWGRQLMHSWWMNRCGHMDQRALWYSLFEQWRHERAAFNFSSSIFEASSKDKVGYAIAKSYTLPAVTTARGVLWGLPGASEADGSGFGSGERFACDGVCGELFIASGCLIEPLALPHVLLLPTSPWQDRASGSRMLPLQSGEGSAQWACHFNTNSKYCYKSTSLEPRPLPKRSPSELKKHCRRKDSASVHSSTWEPGFRYVCRCDEL